MSQADIKITVSILLNPRDKKAVQVTDGIRKHWIPKSKIRVCEGSLVAGETVVITIPEWLAKSKGFI